MRSNQFFSLFLELLWEGGTHSKVTFEGGTHSKETFANCNRVFLFLMLCSLHSRQIGHINLIELLGVAMSCYKDLWDIEMSDY